MTGTTGRKGRPWADVEVEAVRLRYAAEGGHALARDLGRAYSAVVNVAQRLRLRRGVAAPARPERGPCVHCGAARATRPRGLCWRCHADVGVRSAYDVRSKAGRDKMYAPPPDAPCPHPPGSAGRIETLTRRAAAGHALFHPEDTR